MAGQPGNWSDGAVIAGRYTITSLLGAGGMGEVYRAWDGNLGTEVVIKVPLPEVLRNPEFVDRFDREIRSLVRLAHPSIVRVTDCGVHQGLPFAVMAFLPGGSLKDLLQDASGQPVPQTVDQLAGWLPAIASALDFIHTQNFIHRDVKPANILFDAHGFPYLSDFGIAKVHADNADASRGASLTAQNMVLGTPEYMAPELIMGGEVDGRIDQYALAVTVYEMLSGQTPFQGQPTAVLVMHTHQQPPPLAHFRTDLPPELEETLLIGMAKSPEQRFASCAEFAEAVLASGGQGARPAAMPGRSPPARVPAASTPALGQPRQTLVAPARTMVASTAPTQAQAAATLMEARPQPPAPPPLITEPSQPSVAPKRSSRGSKQTLLWTAVGLGTLALSGGLFALGLRHGQSRGAADQQPPALLEIAPDAKADAAFNFSNSLGMTMVNIRPGRFLASEAKTREDRTSSTLNSPFWISAHEVTVAQYFAFLESAGEKNRDLHHPDWLRALRAARSYPEAYAAMKDSFRRNSAPIVGLNSADAEAFCAWLTATDGARQKVTYRLPTRDEWICALRAGSTTRFYWGEELAGGKFNAPGDVDGEADLAAVGSFPPNAWGLHDMTGNVREMLHGPQPAVIGGGWNDRLGSAPSLTPEPISAPATDIGFRIVAIPTPTTKSPQAVP